MTLGDNAEQVLREGLAEALNEAHQDWRVRVGITHETLRVEWHEAKTEDKARLRELADTLISREFRRG